MKSYLIAGLIVLTAVLASLAGTCRADDIETVTVNTSALESLGSDAPFALAFSLTDGGVLDNNTVTLSDFSFGGGSASGTAITSDCVTAFFTCGGESGVISATDPGSSVVVLDDSDLYNGLVEDFTPGSTLSFSVDLTTNPDICLGCGDDTFVFQILTQCGSITDPCNNVPTTDTLFSSFVTVDLAEDSVSAFSSDPSTPFAGMTGTATPAVPEPGSLFLLGTGLAGLALLRRKFRAGLL